MSDFVRLWRKSLTAGRLIYLRPSWLPLRYGKELIDFCCYFAQVLCSGSKRQYSYRFVIETFQVSRTQSLTACQLNRDQRAVCRLILQQELHAVKSTSEWHTSIPLQAALNVAWFLRTIPVIFQISNSTELKIAYKNVEITPSIYATFR